MNLEPWDGGASGQQLADMRSSEAYARTGFWPARAVVRAHGTRPPSAVRQTSGLRLHAAAHQLLAGAGRNIDPGVLLAVAPRRPRARRIGSLAVVLARLRDAIALLRIELGLGGRASLAAGDEGYGESGHDGGCD